MLCSRNTLISPQVSFRDHPMSLHSTNSRSSETYERTFWDATLVPTVRFSLLVTLCLCLTFVPRLANARETLTRFVQQTKEGRSIVLSGAEGERLRVTPYGNNIVRVQAVRRDEAFFPDDRYEMVESHKWPGSFSVTEKGPALILTTGKNGMTVLVSKASMRLSFSQGRSDPPFLQESGGVWWEGDTIGTSFVPDAGEHFTGLGHGYYGREQSLDLKGTIAHRNYGSAHGQQSPLIVPFYLSSKGYGVFLNSTFPNTFNFGKDGRYEFSIVGDGRMDYFVILGPDFAKILDLYTQLTGRPRLPPRAFFGLGLSDKGNDHTSPDPSDEAWWKRKITAQRDAGFPIDHIINDNRWRAGGGKRCESYFAWDSTRYPDPREYEEWIRTHGLVLTIDFNRCIASHSAGWKPEYNVPLSDSIEFGDSAPDFTKKEVREWFWNLFWDKSIDPSLGFPGDALWIDEFDEMGKIPLTAVLGNGRTWREMKNDWFFLVAKALVQEGWDRRFKGTKRPFVWVRGMTAGAQRYATLWSGDIEPSYDDMKTQVRSMQLAGLSGFPFWGHDAGGFFDWKSGKGPDDAMYRQWSMAFGSFSPFWKPHGMGQSRWPLDRPPDVQKDAKTYCTLRYRLIPYLYTCAHEASETGTPIARAMVIDHQHDSLAWKSELQYMWGKEFLVAPNCADSGAVSVWLPQGTWYDFWDDTQYQGSRILSYEAPTGRLPLFVRAGSIVPMSPFAPSTAFTPRDTLTFHVYTGDSASFALYEDDGTTEAYRNGKYRTTVVTFSPSDVSLTIHQALGNYRDAPTSRVYTIVLHGLVKPAGFEVNGRVLKELKNQNDVLERREGSVWDERSKTLTLYLKPVRVDQRLEVKRDL